LLIGVENLEKYTQEHLHVQLMQSITVQLKWSGYMVVPNVEISMVATMPP